MRRNLFIVLCTVISANLAIGANNVVLNCPCQLKNSCFQPLDISNVNETSCADENFVRCCSEAEPIVKQTVVISSTTSTEPKQVDNVSVVLPSEMSGIPQTTPSGISDDYMIQMMDRESGNQMLLVFPKHEETTSDVPTTTTTSTTPSSSSTTTVKTTESPNSRPITTPTVTINNTVSNIKRKRISGKRQRTNQNNQKESQAKQIQETPKPNAKIYDVSRRTHFLRRHHDTPLETIEPPILSTGPTVSATRTPGFQSLSNNELRFKIDQDHKTMIETLRDLLNANDNSPIHRPFDTEKGQRFKSFDELVNVEMKKLTENMKMDRKPFRGRIKFQDYKWAAIPDTHQEERLPPTENTPYRGNYNWDAIPDSPLEEWSSSTTSTKKRPSLPYNEFMRAPKLSDFVPSPLWSLQAEDIEIVNTRNPRRRYVTLPFEYIGPETEFVPVVHNGGSLQIIGPIPERFKNRIDDSRLSYDLPAQAVSNF